MCIRFSFPQFLNSHLHNMLLGISLFKVLRVMNWEFMNYDLRLPVIFFIINNYTLSITACESVNDLNDFRLSIISNGN